LGLLDVEKFAFSLKTQSRILFYYFRVLFYKH
jgi:hypothetical protein